MFTAILERIGLRRKRGYVYESDADPGPMRDAVPGALVRTPERRPPWIVVDREPASVVVARWPGRLWQVEIVDAASAADQEPYGGAPVASAGYQRCYAVRVLAERPPATLFGKRGAAVVPVLEAARHLTREQAEALAAARLPDASEAYRRAWSRWLGEDAGEEVLAVSRRPVSPVGDALSLVHALVWHPDRIETDDAGESRLAAPWGDASSALCQAALAFGAPQLLRGKDRALLTRAWDETFGA